MATFKEVYDLLVKKGHADVYSSRGTHYRVEALNGNIVGFLDKSGRVTIHEDCWGENITCQQTRAGGIYNGSPSIHDWYEANK